MATIEQNPRRKWETDFVIDVITQWQNSILSPGEDQGARIPLATERKSLIGLTLSV